MLLIKFPKCLDLISFLRSQSNVTTFHIATPTNTNMNCEARAKTDI